MIKKIQGKDIVRDFGYEKDITFKRTWHQDLNNQEKSAYPENRKLITGCVLKHTYT